MDLVKRISILILSLSLTTPSFADDDAPEITPGDEAKTAPAKTVTEQPKATPDPKPAKPKPPEKGKRVCGSTVPDLIKKAPLAKMAFDMLLAKEGKPYIHNRVNYGTGVELPSGGTTLDVKACIMSNLATCRSRIRSTDKAIIMVGKNTGTIQLIQEDEDGKISNKYVMNVCLDSKKIFPITMSFTHNIGWFFSPLHFRTTLTEGKKAGEMNIKTIVQRRGEAPALFSQSVYRQKKAPTTATEPTQTGEN